MVKVVDKQAAFNAGILTNKLRGRDDLSQYTNGVSDAVNFFASKYGPIIKRTGTVYKWDVGHIKQKVLLVPFVFSVRKSLILEFLDRKIRFYGFNGEDFGPIASAEDPTQPYEISTPFDADILEHISYAQSLDVIYLAFPGGKTRPKELRRYADNHWELIDYTFEDGPYDDQNFDPNKKIKINSTSVGSATLTTTGFTLSADDVGRHVRINHTETDTDSERWGWGIITAVTGSNTATVNMMQKAWGTSDTADFRFGAWSDAKGWPTLCTIHEQRLVWSGTTNYPWIWASNSFNYHNFSPSDYSGVIKDSNAIYYNMSSDKVAPVKWLASMGSLIIGTELYEMRMYSAGAGLAPGDCVIRRESTYGVHDALPVITDDTLIFIQRLQRKLRASSYDYTRDAYVGPELTTLAESLTIAGMKKIVQQREPNDLFWALMEDGSLLTMTHDKEQEVTAWTKTNLGGDDVRVVDIAVVPSSVYRQDVVVLWVERTIDHITKRYAELLCRDYTENVELKDVTFLDCAMRYQGESTTEITGLDYLEGQKVRVTNRGALHEDAWVENGRVTLKYPVTDSWVGLPYEAYFETLERDFNDKQISTKMSRVRIHRMVLYILRTLGLTVTQQVRGLTTQLITFTPISKMDTPPEPVSGQKEHDIMTAWTSSDMHYTLKFESEPALPCTVAGIYTGVEINAL